MAQPTVEDASTEQLVEWSGLLGLELPALEETLRHAQVRLDKKRKFRDDIKRELLYRPLADAQHKTQERMANQPVKTKLRMLAALVRTYLRQFPAEFNGSESGEELDVRVLYLTSASSAAGLARISFGTVGRSSVDLEPDGTATRKDGKLVNVLKDHPRTWDFGMKP